MSSLVTPLPPCQAQTVADIVYPARAFSSCRGEVDSPGDAGGTNAIEDCRRSAKPQRARRVFSTATLLRMASQALWLAGYGPPTDAPSPAEAKMDEPVSTSLQFAQDLEQRIGV